MSRRYIKNWLLYDNLKDLWYCNLRNDYGSNMGVLKVCKGCCQDSRRKEGVHEQTKKF